MLRNCKLKAKNLAKNLEKLEKKWLTILTVCCRISLDLNIQGKCWIKLHSRSKTLRGNWSRCWSKGARGILVEG